MQRAWLLGIQVWRENETSRHSLCWAFQHTRINFICLFFWLHNFDVESTLLAKCPRPWLEFCSSYNSWTSVLSGRQPRMRTSRYERILEGRYFTALFIFDNISNMNWNLMPEVYKHVVDILFHLSTLRLDKKRMQTTMKPDSLLAAWACAGIPSIRQCAFSSFLCLSVSFSWFF